MVEIDENTIVEADGYLYKIRPALAGDGWVIMYAELVPRSLFWDVVCDAKFSERDVVLVIPRFEQAVRTLRRMLSS